MEELELIKAVMEEIKSNLSISVHTSREADLGESYTIVKVKLYLNGELISEDADTIR
jgi:hypothetical protein